MSETKDIKSDLQITVNTVLFRNDKASKGTSEQVNKRE